MKKIIPFIVLLLFISSCVSTKSTIKNIDNSVYIPQLYDNTTFIVKEFSKDKNYGYNKDYPVNIYFGTPKNGTLNQERYLNALAGPNGENIIYTRLESCCPFPTTKNEMGVGLLDVYELKWEGLKNPIILYLNIYEKGHVLVPLGLSLKKK